MRFKNGVEINTSDAKRRQKRQLLSDPFKVAAKKIIVIDIAAGVRFPLRVGAPILA